MIKKHYFLPIIFLYVLITSCSSDDDILGQFELTEYELEVVDYFKEIALGFEGGNSSEVTRKWGSTMSVYLGGDLTTSLIEKMDSTVFRINQLATDGFQIEIVTDPNVSNCYVFYGTESDYLNIFPEDEGRLGPNFAVFRVWWNNNFINRARILIATDRATPEEQESLLLEELTQSLGFGKDSPRYPNSIFYETATLGGFATEYAPIDTDLIRLLYHPDMRVGLNRKGVERTLGEILSSE